MVFRSETVPLDQIDPSDLFFRVTSREDADDLAPSIRTAGLINPAVLAIKNEGFVIVSGFRRIRAHQDLGLAEIPARIAPRDARKIDLAKLAVADNALQRPLDLIETSRALALLSVQYKNIPDLARAAGSMGLPRDPSLVKKLLPLSRLSGVIREGVRSNAIALPMAQLLGDLDPGAAVELARLFLTLKLSLNKQREVYSLAEEIAARDDIAIPDLLAREPVQAIVNDENLDRSQKTGQIRRYLKKERFPRLTRARDAFEENLKRLKPGPGVRLAPPKNFEGLVYTLTLQFKNRDELRERRGALERMLNNPVLEKIVPGPPRP
ncbi:MAG: ParB/RepB/Spo0J family partition protein [Desulfobacterales bacterium]|nr:ParB/RepB/Spo0J family partition protein [Desulfobacterales bacterium]